MPSIEYYKDYEKRLQNERQHIYFILDTSERMRGTPIVTLNNVMSKIIMQLKLPEIKVSILEYNSSCYWIIKEYTVAEDFIWEDLKAGGAGNFGAALEELNTELDNSTQWFFSVYESIFIFITSGYVTDNYKESLEKIKKRKCMRRNCIIAIPIGKGANVELSEEIVNYTWERNIIEIEDLGTFIYPILLMDQDAYFRKYGDNDFLPDFMCNPDNTDQDDFWEFFGGEFDAPEETIQEKTTEKNTDPEKAFVEDTFQKALAEILLRTGKETLKNKNKLIAHLSDMAPTCKKEIHILNRSCSPEFLQMFYVSEIQNTTLRKQTIGKARTILLDEEGLSESWASLIVDALEYAVWGR